VRARRDRAPAGRVPGQAARELAPVVRVRVPAGQAARELAPVVRVRVRVPVVRVRVPAGQAARELAPVVRGQAERAAGARVPAGQAVRAAGARVPAGQAVRAAGARVRERGQTVRVVGARVRELALVVQVRVPAGQTARELAPGARVRERAPAGWVRRRRGPPGARPSARGRSGAPGPGPWVTAEPEVPAADRRRVPGPVRRERPPVAGPGLRKPGTARAVRVGPAPEAHSTWGRKPSASAAV
jgi:hypothetical protein